MEKCRKLRFAIIGSLLTKSFTILTRPGEENHLCLIQTKKYTIPYLQNLVKINLRYDALSIDSDKGDKLTQHFFATL